MEDAPEVLLGHGGQGLDVCPGLGAHGKDLGGLLNPCLPSTRLGRGFKPGRRLPREAPRLIHTNRPGHEQAQT